MVRLGDHHLFHKQYNLKPFKTIYHETAKHSQRVVNSGYVST